MGDTGNALLAAIAITSALYHREKTGEGQAVSTSIVNAGLLHTSYAWIHADGTPADWGHVDGDQYGLSPYYRLYQGSDETWLFLAAVSNPERARLTAVIGELEAVSGNSEQVAELLTAEFRRRTAAEWFTQLDEAGVPVEIVDERFCRTLFDDPEAKTAQLVAETWSGSVGRFEDPGFLVKVSPAECVIQRGPAMCGEHSREILLEHGYVDAEVDALVADKAILDAARDRS
jgi:crotonobetainyl-CoA:carnitine CoA-transferase CaiB-like acyl-CoA transferase